METSSNFNTVVDFELSNTGIYRKVLSVLAINDGKYFVDIRLYFVDGPSERPTKIGVCLTKEEFENILPYLSEKKPHKIDGHRKISLIIGNSGWLYDLKLTKADGKESNITLTFKEMDKIFAFKDEIFKNCI